MDRRFQVVVGALVALLLINMLFFSTNQLRDSRLKRLTSALPSIQEEGREFANTAVLGEYNVLLLGIDSRTERGLAEEIASQSYRTDTMILASLDVRTKTARLISIPRDTRVKINDRYNKINAAFVYGGVDLAKEVVEDFVGVEIDRTVIVDFTSLVKIVDILGGVEIDVPVRMYRPTEDIDLKPGLQVLNGHDALAYSRFRGTANGDIDRAARQQEVIQALIKQIVSVRGVASIPSLYRTMEENLVTDIPLTEFVALGKLAAPVMRNGIQTMVVPGRNANIDGISFWEADKEAFLEMLHPPKEKAATSSKESDKGKGTTGTSTGTNTSKK